MVADCGHGQANHARLFTHRPIKNVSSPAHQPSSLGVTSPLPDLSSCSGASCKACIPFVVYHVFRRRHPFDVAVFWARNRRVVSKSRTRAMIAHGIPKCPATVAVAKAFRNDTEIRNCCVSHVYESCSLYCTVFGYRNSSVRAIACCC